MIDAAGAIYVIGGDSGGIHYHDVWVTTDGGARPDSVKEGGGRRVLQGVLLWYSGVLGGSIGYSGLLEGSSRGIRGILWGT